jgi:Gpi18-like mannosyltransferase
MNWREQCQDRARSHLSSGIPFVLLVWALSRFIVILTLLAASTTSIAEANRVTALDWQVFANWDGRAYAEIATSGYRYSSDLKAVSVAFFPLFPLLANGLMRLGLPFAIAGTLINNLAFLGTLLLLNHWLEKRHSPAIGRWTIVALAYHPFSLFGSVAYTEGLFLLLSTATLRAFDQQKYWQTALWGALATATRPTGVALVPALLLVSWQERRSLPAYLASCSTAIGILLYSLYCWGQFGNPIAFLHAQQPWRTSGVAWQGWQKILTQIFLGTVDWQTGTLKTPWHPVSLGLLVAIALLLWHFRHKLGRAIGYAYAGVVLLLWLLIGDPLINGLMVFGSGYLLWHLRTQLLPVMLSYGFTGLGLIVFSGSTISLGRIAYGLVPVTIALGILFARYSRWGRMAIGFFTILLIGFSTRFAQFLWAG